VRVSVLQMGNFLSTLFDTPSAEYTHPTPAVPLAHPAPGLPIAVQVPQASQLIDSQTQGATQQKQDPFQKFPIILVEELVLALDADGNQLPPIRISSKLDRTGLVAKGGLTEGSIVTRKFYDGGDDKKLMLYQYAGADEQIRSVDYKFFKFVDSGLWLTVDPRKDGKFYISSVPHPFLLNGDYLTDPVSGLVATYAPELRYDDYMYLTEPTDSRYVEPYQRYVLVRTDDSQLLKQMTPWRDVNWKAVALQAAALGIVGYAGYQIGKRRKMRE
jgi:hypothetical protein